MNSERFLPKSTWMSGLQRSQRCCSRSNGENFTSLISNSRFLWTSKLNSIILSPLNSQKVFAGLWKHKLQHNLLGPEVYFMYVFSRMLAERHLSTLCLSPRIFFRPLRWSLRTFKKICARWEKTWSVNFYIQPLICSFYMFGPWKKLRKAPLADNMSSSRWVFVLYFVYFWEYNGK